MVRQISGTLTITLKKEAEGYTIEASGSKGIRVDPQPALQLETLLSDPQITDTRKDLSSQTAPATTDAIQKLGKALYDSLFTNQDILLAFGKAQGSASADNSVRLRLQIEPTELAALPWETLHDGKDWLSAQSSTPLVRKLNFTENRKPLQKLQIRGALRILFVGASPEGLDDLKVEKTANELEALLEAPIKKKQIVFDKLLNATLEDLQQGLLKGYHILYFAGHGSPEGIFLDDGEGDVIEKEGKVIGRERGDKSLVSAETLAQALKGKQTRLVFLAACETSKASDKTSEGSRLLRGFAQELAERSNLPAIVAMQYFISDMQANPLTTQFFAALAAGHPVDMAMAEARSILMKKGQVSRDVFSPVLYLQAEDGALFPKAKNWPAISLGVALLIAAIVGGGFARSAELNQIKASLEASETMLALNKEDINALISSLRAAKTLKHSLLLRLSQPDMQLQEQVGLTLQKSVYQVKERNRIKIPNDSDKAVFSPNGQIIAIVQVNGTVSLWERIGKQIPEFKPFNVGGQVRSLSFSPDSQQLITVSIDEVVKWWNLNGQQVGKDLKQPGSINKVMFGSNGKLMIISDNKLIDLESATPLVDFPGSGIGYNTFSPDGKLIAIGADAGDIVSILDVNSKQKIVEIKGFPFFNSNIPVSISFSPDSKLIAAAGYQDDTIYLWDLQGNQLAKLKAHQGGIRDIFFSPDGEQLATIGIDGTLRIWQDLEGKQLSELKFGLDRYRGTFTLSSDGQLLAADSSQGLILWNLQKRQELQFSQRFTDISELHFGTDNHLLAVSESNGTIHLLDVENQQHLDTFKGNNIESSQGSFTRQNYGKFLQGLSLSKDGNLLAIGGNDTITVHSRNGEQLITFPEGSVLEEGIVVPNWVQATAFEPSGNLLATSTVFGKVRLWNWKERKEVLPNPIKANETQTFSVVFSPKGNLIATAGLDGSTNGVRLWNLSGEKLAEFKGHQGRVNQVIFSSDGSLLATAGMDGAARIWDLSGQQLAEFEGGDSVESIAFSLDGKQLTIARLSRVDLFQIEDLDELLVRGCKWVGDYLASNSNAASDKNLCNGIDSRK